MDGEGDRGGAVKTVSDIKSEETQPVRPVTGKLQSANFKSGLLLTIGAWLGSRIVVSAAWGPAKSLLLRYVAMDPLGQH